MSALLQNQSERCIVERLQSGGILAVGHMHKARAVAGQRHQRERSAGPMEFGRDAMMRTCVGEGESQRRLRVAMLMRGDTGGRTAKRAPSVAADNEAGAECVAQSVVTVTLS